MEISFYGKSVVIPTQVTLIPKISDIEVRSLDSKSRCSRHSKYLKSSGRPCGRLVRTVFIVVAMIALGVSLVVLRNCLGVVVMAWNH